MSTFWRRMSGYAVAALTGIFAVALMALAGWLLAKSWEQPPILHLQMAIVGVRFFALARAGGRYLERLVSHDAAFRLTTETRTGIYEDMRAKLPAGVRLRSGEWASRFSGDIEQLQDETLRYRQPVLTALVTAGITIAAFAIASPVAALVLTLLLVASAAAGTFVSQRLASVAEERIVPLAGDLRELVLDHARSIVTLRAYGVERQWRDRILGIDREMASVARRLAFGAGAASAVTVAAGGLALVATVLVVSPAVAAGHGDGAVLAMLALGALAVFEIWGAIPQALLARRRVLAARKRVDAALASTTSAGVPAEAGAPLRTALPLTLSGFSAAWPGGDPVFAPIDVRLDAGSVVAVRGHSGSGKSTLAAALVRFIDHTGTFDLGGQAAADVSPESIRDKVLLVEQRPHIFHESLRQNLLFANDRASDEQLLDVLHAVGLTEWLTERDGLDTDLGEAGGSVSGGQAQRIALARALLANPEVLILDEPTANVDIDTAEPLMRDLLQAARSADRAVLVISHVPLPPGIDHSEISLGAAVR